MSEKTYRGKDIDVTFEMKRCIHAAECGKRLQIVFDTAKRPWAQPDNASADQVQDTINHCPSGALKYSRNDGGAQEAAPEKNTIIVTDSGEYRIHGDVLLATAAGTVIADEHRLTLCRCGDSNNKPFCDNSHKKAGFNAPGTVGGNAEQTPEEIPAGGLKIVTAQNGPLLLQGNFEILDASGKHVFRGKKAALCRCGGSENKPFCDGNHKQNGFTAS